MNTTLRLALVVFVSSLMSACVSNPTGTSPNARITPPKTVAFLPSDSERATDYTAKIKAVLESVGFTVVSSPSAHYKVQLSMGGGYSISCSITLYKNGGERLVEGNAVNTGFGTAIARNTSYDNIVDSALEQFKRQLHAHLVER